MSSLGISRYLLSFFFLFVFLAGGYASYHYYSHLCKSERLNLAERQNLLEKKLSQRIQEHWSQTIQATIRSTKRAIPSSREHLSKALKVIVESREDVRQAFFVDQETIFLPQWKKFRVTKLREDLSLTLFENPEFKQAEILEYQSQKYEAAVEIYERFWLENPDNFQAAAALARCLYKIKKYSRAEKIYRQIFTQNPSALVQGDVPLAITAAFQLLNIYEATGNSPAATAFALSLYEDLLDEKWELSAFKLDFFKKRIKTITPWLGADAQFTRSFTQLLKREKDLEAVKRYVRFISRRVIPFIEGSIIQDYRVYFLAGKGERAQFLLVIPDGRNYIVLDIDYKKYLQHYLVSFLRTLARDNKIGLRLRWAGVALEVEAAPPGTLQEVAVSPDFPDLWATLSFPDSTAQLLENRLLQYKWYFAGGYTLFVAVLSLVYFVLNKQIQFAELKSDFVSHVSHELKTPLTSLRMFSEMLKSNHRLSAKKRQQYYDIMLEESVRLSSLIENLLDISRIERKKSQYAFRPENVDTVLRAALGVFQSTLKSGRRRIKSCLATPVEASMDRSAVIQMVLNILDNARKFSPDNSKIAVSSRVESSKAVIQINDQGIGMSPAEIRKVFRRFYQVKKAYEDKFKGVGLGLAIVKNIAQAHHARLTLDSVKGRGTTVTVSLPLLNN
ncbi:tetratricopeptide repeat protein [candidate division FCPU426 bacterium]|nr:tetratricopeptide repeat protein [candidate division FCPU426 bacterium]